MKQDYNISPEEWERIQQFLDGELSPAEQQAFDEQLKTNESLRDKLKEAELLRLGIRQAEVRNQLQEYHTHTSKTTGRIISFSRKWIAAASVIVLAGLSGWFFLLKESRYDTLYSKYYSPDPGLMTAMGISNDYTFEKGMVDYKDGNYQQAINAWTPLEEKRPGNDTLSYFLSMSYLAAGEKQQAKTYLQKTLNQPGGAFYKDACWYYGLILLKEKSLEEARKYIAASDHPESNALLTSIK